MTIFEGSGAQVRHGCADKRGMDVVLLSIAMVTVLGAVFAIVVIIPARRRGATLVNRHTFTRKPRTPKVTNRQRRRNARQKQTVDLTPLLSQGVDRTAGRRRGSLTRAS